MPLMHNESIADQRDSLAIFVARARANLGFGRVHHRMIARFGRFPHRNAVLGRRSRAAEKAAIAAGSAGEPAARPQRINCPRIAPLG